jgi:hypothetical protein
MIVFKCEAKRSFIQSGSTQRLTKLVSYSQQQNICKQILKGCKANHFGIGIL